MPPPVAHGIHQLHQADLPGACYVGGAAGAHVTAGNGDDADLLGQVQLAPVVQGRQLLRGGIAGGDRAVFRDELVGPVLQHRQLLGVSSLSKSRITWSSPHVEAHVGAAVEAVGQAGEHMLPGVALHPGKAQGPVQFPGDGSAGGQGPSVMWTMASPPLPGVQHRTVSRVPWSPGWPPPSGKKAV